MMKSIIVTAMLTLLCGPTGPARAEAMPEPVTASPGTCFETGDGSSKFFQPAKCSLSDEESGLPYKCVFDNGDPETECFMRDNGCFVCSGMD